MRVVFFGSSKFVIPIIEILRKNFDLTLVVTTETPEHNLALQGETLRSYPVLNYCIENKIPYLSVQQFNNSTTSNVADAIQQLKKSTPSVGILASFGAIVPKSVLDIFKYGILNIHPSLLPKYRGPTPVQTAILNGDKTTGVTIIKLDEEVDHGPILTQKKELIEKNDTAESLYERLFKLSASSMVQIIELYTKGSLKPQEQDHKKATFTKRLSREDGYIGIKHPPSPQTLERMIRAYYPWPSVWTRYATGPDLVKEKILKFLPDEKIQVEGKKPVDIETLKRGYPNSIKWLEKLFGR